MYPSLQILIGSVTISLQYLALGALGSRKIRG